MCIKAKVCNEVYTLHIIFPKNVIAMLLFIAYWD